MTRESYEIRTEGGKVTIRTQEHSDMDAVSHAYDIGMVQDGDAGSVAPVRELADVPAFPVGVPDGE